MGVNESLALYLHVPFCRRKCGYCSFTSFACREADVPSYLTALKSEMAQRANGQSVGSIYFGGGTPSLLSTEQLAGLLSTVRSLFVVAEDAEISIEANPGTVDEAWLMAVRKLGINRLSLGVQSLNHTELALLGRIHTAAEARQAVRSARSAGFGNLNLDLIYGLPGQSLADWERNLECVLALNPAHLSLYALTLEEDAPMQRLVEKGLLPDIDPDTAASQYEMAEDILARRDYHHYEISNWAKPGFECRHNLIYWRNQPYLGVGLAAHSCQNGHRLANTSDLDKYLDDFNRDLFLPEMDEEISPDLELAETVILGLRLDEGVSVAGMRKRFGADILSIYRTPIQDMTELGLMLFEDGWLSLTPKGRLLSNEVFWRLLPDEVNAKK